MRGALHPPPFRVALLRLVNRGSSIHSWKFTTKILFWLLQKKSETPTGYDTDTDCVPFSGVKNHFSRLIKTPGIE
jgi:hypothetical protein